MTNGTSRRQGRSRALGKGFLGTSILTLGVALAAHDAAALGALSSVWNLPTGPLKHLPRSSREFTLHPFGDQTTAGATPRGFSLFQRGAVSFDAAVLGALREQLGNAGIEMRATPVASGLGLTTGTKTLDVRFYVGGVPLQGYQARAHALADGSLALFGTLPEVDAGETAPAAAGDWPDLQLSFEHAAQSLRDSGEVDGETVVLKGQARCLYVSNNKLMPVWCMTIAAGIRPFSAMADAYESFSVERAFFDVTGKGSVVTHNIVEDKDAVIDLPDLIGDGTLTTEFIKTVVPTTGATPYVQALAPDNVFNYPRTDHRYEEVQAFAHVQAQYDWVHGMGFEWYGPKPLEIHLHVKPGGRSNNALYVPGSTADNSPPTISVDDGDGIDLQNLATDSDVVSHEFGHHVIYKTLRSTDGQSLVLHEGLADFLAFSRSGNACLGESICPKDSGACILPGQCLRSAEIALTYNDSLWTQWAGPQNHLGHLHGQLISGVLWDLRKKGDIPPTETTQLALKAISYFKEASGFSDFIVCLLLADKDLFGGMYFDKIVAAATARGMSEFLTGITKDSIPQPTGTLNGSSALPGGNTTGAADPKKETKKDKNPTKCAVVGGLAAGLPSSALPLLIALVLPLLLALQPTREKARARKPRARDKRVPPPRD